MSHQTVVMTISADRPEYLEETLESWRTVRGAEFAYFVFCVEPGKQFAKAEGMVLDFLSEYTGVLMRNVKRLGVLRNPHYALGLGFEDSDFVVLAEEDVIVSNDILEFFAAMEERYKNNQQVLAVCAENWCAPGNDHDAVFLDSRFCPLVWGTWRDRWENILRDTWDKDYTSGNPDGSHAGWDWNIYRIIKKNDFLIAAPGVGRSMHIGKHGVHMLERDFANSQSLTFMPFHSDFHWVKKV